MAATTAETTKPAAEEHPPPTLADEIRTVIPKHAHFVAPWRSADRTRLGKDSFQAAWTTPDGSWSIRYAGRPDGSTALSAALTGRSVEPARIVVTGPAGTWQFDVDTPRSLIADYLALTGGVERVQPPKFDGFAYIGAVTDDGISTILGNGESVSFTTTGQVSRKLAETMYGGPIDGEDCQARKEFEGTRAELGRLADQARDDVAAQECKHHNAGAALAEAQITARAAGRALGYLEPFYAASVLANIINGPSAQRLVPYAEAARIAADLVEKAIADQHTTREWANR